MSSRSKDETFRDFIAEINNLLYKDADTDSLAERIYVTIDT